MISLFGQIIGASVLLVMSLLYSLEMSVTALLPSLPEIDAELLSFSLLLFLFAMSCLGSWWMVKKIANISSSLSTRKIVSEELPYDPQ